MQKVVSASNDLEFPTMMAMDTNNLREFYLFGRFSLPS